MKKKIAIVDPIISEKDEEIGYSTDAIFNIFSADLMPRNITIATDTIQHMNLMPVYGESQYFVIELSLL